MKLETEGTYLNNNTNVLVSLSLSRSSSRHGVEGATQLPPVLCLSLSFRKAIESWLGRAAGVSLCEAEVGDGTNTRNFQHRQDGSCTPTYAPMPSAISNQLSSQFRNHTGPCEVIAIYCRAKMIKGTK